MSQSPTRPAAEVYDRLVAAVLRPESKPEPHHRFVPGGSGARVTAAFAYRGPHDRTGMSHGWPVQVVTVECAGGRGIVELGESASACLEAGKVIEECPAGRGPNPLLVGSRSDRDASEILGEGFYVFGCQHGTSKR